MQNDFFNLLHFLIRTPSVVGSEHVFFLTIKRELESLGIQTQYYEGVLEADGGQDSPYILTAHVDRHGLLCTGPGEFQYASLTSQFIGDQDGNSVSEQIVDKILDRFLNERVHAYDPRSGAYLGQGTITTAQYCNRRNNVIFQVDDLQGLYPGIPLAYNDQLTVKEGWISAQLDNVISVAIIVELYKQGYRGKALFSAQEEAGRSWRFLWAYFKRKKIQQHHQILVLDTTPFQDKKELQAMDVVFRYRDANAQFSKELTTFCVQTATKLGIRYVLKDSYIEEQNKFRRKNKQSEMSMGRTELGRLISASYGNFSGTTVQVPSYDYHTSNETTSVRSVEAMLKFLAHILIHS